MSSIDSLHAMPALFVGHGSPMNAVEDNAFTRAWAAAADSLPAPTAILCVSAHWETDGTFVTAMDAPRTIHDFYGFPKELFEVLYPAHGLPAMARRIRELITHVPVLPDTTWGLDHGAWSVLCKMFPNASVPVVQLSLDRRMPPQFHYEFGKALRLLRDEGVLILGSGNIVHNLRTVQWEDTAYDWALAFDDAVRARIVDGDHDALVHYESLGPVARMAVPSNEHYLPLLYTLGLQDDQDEVSFFAESVTLGSISMRSVRVG